MAHGKSTVVKALSGVQVSVNIYLYVRVQFFTSTHLSRMCGQINTISLVQDVWTNKHNLIGPGCVDK